MNITRDRPLADIVREVVSDFQDIVRSEVKLAKAEVREETSKAASAAKLSAIGALLGLFSFGFLALTAVRALELRFAPWLSALIVALGLGIPAAALWFAGKGRLKQVHPKPDKTIESIKENLQWNRNPIE